jgi:hypothetical protein
VYSRLAGNEDVNDAAWLYTRPKPHVDTHSARLSHVGVGWRRNRNAIGTVGPRGDISGVGFPFYG